MGKGTQMSDWRTRLLGSPEARDAMWARSRARAAEQVEARAPGAVRTAGDRLVGFLESRGAVTPETAATLRGTVAEAATAMAPTAPVVPGAAAVPGAEFVATPVADAAADGGLLARALGINAVAAPPVAPPVAAVDANTDFLAHALRGLQNVDPQTRTEVLADAVSRRAAATGEGVDGLLARALVEGGDHAGAAAALHDALASRIAPVVDDAAAAAATAAAPVVHTSTEAISRIAPLASDTAAPVVETVLHGAGDEAVRAADLGASTLGRLADDLVKGLRIIRG